MRKLFLSLVFVLATGSTLMNATVFNNDIIETKTEHITIEEDFSCAGDCVKESKKKISEEVETLGEDPNDHIDDYKLEYGYCYYTNCVD